MKPFTRADRVGELIQRCLADVIRKDIKDPRLAMATITGVKMSRDIKSAKVYFSVTGSKKRREEVQKGFESALGFIKRTLAEQLELRYMPDLKFFYDESFEYGSHIDKILKSINTDHGENHKTLEEKR